MSSIAPYQQLPVLIMAPSPMIDPVCRGVDAGADRNRFTRG